MIRLFSKFYIKSEYTEEQKRTAWGTLCAIVGIGLNIFLFLIKLLAGVISGSVAITADAMNNLSDAGSSVVSMIGFRLAAQEADRRHPYGHGRVEYLAGLAISCMILLVGAELLRTSVVKIIHPESTDFSIIILAILVISIIVKCYMAMYNTSVGKMINSATLKAVAKDSISDCGATSIVLIAMIVEHYFGIAIDGFAGIVVSGFIFWTGISSVRETVDPLLGVMPDDEFLEELEQYVLEFNPERIVGVHDLMVHDYGPSRKIISLHAEVPAEGNILELHDTIDVLEHMLGERYNCNATIHMDPVITKDERVTELKQKVSAVVAEYDSDLSIHDFRVVFGDTHTNLLFDVVIPFRYAKTADEVSDEIMLLIQEKIGPYYFSVIDIDRK